MEPPWAVVVDRNSASRALMSEILEEQGFSVIRAEEIPTARDALANHELSLVSFGFESSRDDYRSLIESATQSRSQPLLVGVGEPAPADHAVAAELFDVVTAPIGRTALERLVRRCKTRLGLREQIRLLQTELQHRHGFRGLVGRSEAIHRLRADIERLSGSDEPVWISGEPGTGKETVARLLQTQSPRREGEFVLVDCAQVDRLDSLLSPDGELARGSEGTLYLEELPALRMDLQEDLLRAVGLHRARSTEPRAARLVVGSRIDPGRASADGRLLPELHRQLGVAAVSIPPLRDRREDIVLLADFFLAQICEINRLRRIHLGPDAVAHLERYVWPGNVEQLRGAIEQAAIVVRGDVIHQADLPGQVREFHESSDAPAIPDQPSRRPFRNVKREVVEAFERAYLADLLERHAGNVTAASQQAGMLRSALQRLLRKYGLKSAEFRKGRRPGVQPQASEPADESR